MQKDEIKAMFPTYPVKYDPFEACEFCKGTGLKGTTTKTPCICTCVDHKYSTWAGKSLAKIGREMKAELEEVGDE